MAKRLDSQRIPLEISLVRLAYNKPEKPTVSNSTAGEKSKKPFPDKENQGVVEEAIKSDTLLQSPKEQASISLDQVKSVWDNIVNNLANIKMSVSTYLSEGEPTKVQGNVLTVAFPKNYSLHKESLERKENKAIIEKAASELCNTDLRVNFILVAQTKHEQDAHGNPFIKSALEMFGGRVVREG
jgi:hypothetical protein